LVALVLDFMLVAGLSVFIVVIVCCRFVVGALQNLSNGF